MLGFPQCIKKVFAEAELKRVRVHYVAKEVRNFRPVGLGKLPFRNEGMYLYNTYIFQGPLR